MPTYVYVNENDPDDVVEKIYPVSKFRRRRKFNGQWYVVSPALQQRGFRSGEHGYPYWSDNLGTTPNQVRELQDVFCDAGCGLQEVNAMGDVRVRSRAHRRQLMKARGLIDRNSYTGH